MNDRTIIVSSTPFALNTADDFGLVNRLIRKRAPGLVMTDADVPDGDQQFAIQAADGDLYMGSDYFDVLKSLLDEVQPFLKGAVRLSVKEDCDAAGEAEYLYAGSTAEAVKALRIESAKADLADVLLVHGVSMEDIAPPVKSAKQLSALAIAGIGLKHHGNPIPHWWYAAAKDLQAGIFGEEGSAENELPDAANATAAHDRPTSDRPRGG